MAHWGPVEHKPLKDWGAWEWGVLVAFAIVIIVLWVLGVGT